jgi:hypothetical protein
VTIHAFGCMVVTEEPGKKRLTGITDLITKVKQRWAPLVLADVTLEVRPGAVGRGFRILWPGSAYAFEL